MSSLFAAIGFRWWVDIDGDGPFTLQKCAWTGERRTVIKGRNIRHVTPWSKRPHWEQ